MPSFEYHEPGSLTELSDMLQAFGGEAAILAGGTDLLPRFRRGLIAPRHVLNIKKIPGLADIVADGEGVKVGAAATLYEVEKFLAVRPQYQVLAQAVHSVGSCQVRNRATLAGNVCNASPAADTLPALAVLDARVIASGSGGERRIPLEDFFTGPGRTVLERTEAVSAVFIPEADGARGCYLKQSRRRLVDLATVGVAVFSGRHGVRIGLGAVAPTVIRARAAEAFLAGAGLSPETASRAAALAIEGISPISDLRGSREYRTALAEVLVRRALMTVWGGERP